MNLQLGDIVAVRGTKLISRLISDMTGPISHVGIVTSLEPIFVTQAVEPRVATLTLEQTLLESRYAYALQPLLLKPEQRYAICTYALSKVGEGYDTWDILLQALNVIFHTNWFTEEGASNSKVICSELVAQAYEQVGYIFGVPDRAATPSEIFDFALLHPITYAVVKLK